MGFESIMCDLSGSLRRSDFEKTKVFGSGLYVLYCAADRNEKLLRNVAAKHHVYFDAGINFLKFEWSTNNVLDDGCFRVVDDEYVIYDDTQDKRVYISTESWCNNNILFDILEDIKDIRVEEVKGEF